MRDETSAGRVSWVKELALSAIQVLLASREVVLILLRQECGLVVIEPPGDPG